MPNRIIRLGFFVCKKLMRVRGIEPRPIAWEAIILPLNYTRVFEIFFNPPFNVTPTEAGF